MKYTFQIGDRTKGHDTKVFTDPEQARAQFMELKEGCFVIATKKEGETDYRVLKPSDGFDALDEKVLALPQNVGG